MPLSTTELDLISELQSELTRTRGQDLLNRRYYQCRQRIEQLGMAIPPDMRRFLVIANWPRVVVDTKVARQQVRALILPGQETFDPKLRAIYDANNLAAHLKMFNRDRMIYGRSFMSVGTNERNPDLPWMRVESPLGMAALVDVKTETMIAAARFYRARPSLNKGATHLTLYVPGRTVHAELGGTGWEQVGDADEHGFPVPIVMHLNRRLSGEWDGESELTDIIPLTDSVARSLTNLQFAQEAHGIPRMFMTGVTQGDFIDPDTKKPIPMFEAYFDAIHTLTKADAKVGQLDAADLKNFETAVKIYGTQAATVTGFPGRYFGLTSVNPPSADGIRAEEAELVRSVEGDNEEVGMTLGWAGALALRFATGDEVDGNRVRVDWHDPATPTVAQRTDALVKLRQVGAISREGMWDEMGWSEARKSKERGYLADEAAADPDLDLARQLTTSNAPAA